MDENDEYWSYFQVSLASEPDGYVGINVEIEEQTNARIVVGIINSYSQFVDCEYGDTCYIHVNQDEWDDYQTVYVNALIDDNRSGGSGKIKVSAESGDPDYNGRSREVSVTESDTVGAAMLFPDGQPSRISEGGQASFSVSLAVEPYADVTVKVSSSHPDITVTNPSNKTLTFTSTNYSSKQSVTLRATEDNIAQTARATITVTASSTGDSDYDKLTGSFSVTEQENDTARFLLSNFQSSLTVPEGGSHTYSVRLNSEPSANVIVTINGAGGDISVDTDLSTQGNQNTLTFTPNNYGNNQSVTVSAAEDDNDYTSETATLTHSISGASEYRGQSISNIAVTTRDNDTKILVDADPNTDGEQTQLTVREGSTASYTVKLNIQPTSNVTVAIAEGAGDNNDASLRVTSPSNKTLTFTPQNWDTGQAVRIRANSDSDAINGTRTITHTASGAAEFNGKTKSLTATERDSQARINLRKNNSNVSNVTVVEEATATYDVSLNAQPAASVTVTIAGATSGNYTDEDITASPVSLTFTPQNYGTAQTVTLTAAADDDLDDGRRTITHTASSPGATHSGYDGVPVKSLTARESDTTGQVKLRNAADTADITTLGVPEGETATYRVKLSHQPKSAVTVRIAQGTTAPNKDTDLRVTTSRTLYFNTGNWDQAKTVTLRANQDDDQFNGARDFVHTATGGGYNSAVATLTATEQDADASFKFTNADGNDLATLTVPEDGSANYRIALTTQPTAAVLVDLTTTGDPDVTVSPALVVFTTTNWDIPQQVTAYAAEEVVGRYGDASLADDSGNGVAAITHKASSSDAVYNGKAGDLVATELDNEPGIVLRNTADDATATRLDVREGSTATYGVKLNSPPATGVTVTIEITGKTTVPGNDPDLNVDTDRNTAGNQNTLTFNAADWNIAKTVTVRAANDNSVRKCRPERVFTHTVIGEGGAFTPIYRELHSHGGDDDDHERGPQIGGAFPTNLTANELDTDSRHVVLCSGTGNFAISNLIVPENAPKRYSVRLNRPPSGNVTVTIREASGGVNDTDLTVQTGSLTFTTDNWNRPQVVAAEDDDLSSGARNINHTASGGYAGATLRAIEQDTDADPGFTGSYLVALDSTATTVSLRLVKSDPDSGNVWIKTSPEVNPNCFRLPPGGIVKNLTPDTEYRFGRYSTGLYECAGGLGSGSVESETDAVTLTSANVTLSGATLSVAGWTHSRDGWVRDGDWTFRADTGPDAAACSAAQTGNSVTLTGLDSGATYTYIMYQGKNCDKAVANFPAFTTPGSAMTAATTATTAALTIPNRAATWYHQHDGDGASCLGPVNGSATGAVTGLAQNTEYVFKAYSDAGCATEIAHKPARTWNPALAASNVGLTTATLTFSGWAIGTGAGKDGNWWYKHGNTGAACTPQDTTGQSGATVKLTGLSTNTGYTYQAFGDSNCTAANLLDTANRFTTVSAQSPGDRKSGEDFTLHADNDNPYGIWSNSTTMWVSDLSDDHIYAYRMSDRARDTTEEFDLPADNGNPRGIWSDGTTMWVSDVSDDHIYAYRMSDQSRDTSKEFALADSNDGAQDNGSPRGIWSDGTTMWVADIGDDKLYAYTLATGARDTSKEFDTHGDNPSPMHLWSDGTTIWVADWAADKVFAYTLATGARVSSKEFAATTHSTDAQLTGLWSDGATMWVADRPDSGADKLFAYHGPNTWVKGLRATGVLKTSATLELLNHSAAWWYQSTTTSHTSCTGVGSGTSTVNLSTLTAGTTYTFAAYDQTGCNAADLIGSVTFTTAGKGSRDADKDITVSIADIAEEPYYKDTPFLTFYPASEIAGIWSDGTTMWVNDGLWNGFAYAYTLATRARRSGLDFKTGTNYLAGHGNTILAYEAPKQRVYAYTRANADTSWTSNDARTWDPTAANAAVDAVATDGRTVWIADHDDAWVYAYHFADGARDAAKEFALHADNAKPIGMWTDEGGSVAWILDSEDKKVYAYRLSDGSRLPGKDYDTLKAAGITLPRGLWSDGTTMWISGSGKWESGVVTGEHKLYAFEAHAGFPSVGATAGATTAQLKLFNHTGNWHYQATTGPDTTCSSPAQTGATASLTGLDVGTTYTYTAYSDSACSASNSLGSATFTTGSPVLSAAYTHDAATLTLAGWVAGTGAGKDGNWHYRADAGPHAACSTSPVTGASVNLTGLTAGNAYTYTAYSDANCTATVIDVAPAFRTYASAAALAAGVATATTIPLTLTNYDGDWWYKYTVPATPAGVCTAAESGATEARATGLATATDYTFKAYGDDACASELTVGASATTTTPELTAPDVKSRTATLRLTGWDFTHDGGWRYRGPANQCRGPFTRQDIRITAGSQITLTAGNTYTYTAYSNAQGSGSCVSQNLIDAAPAFITKATIQPEEFDNGKTISSINSLGTFSPRSIWSDGTTLWVLDNFDEQLEAYNLSGKTREYARDINAASIWTPVSFTSDGATVWVAQRNLNRLWAYSLAGRVRTPGKDITLHPDNGDRSHLWTDGDDHVGGGRR